MSKRQQQERLPLWGAQTRHEYHNGELSDSDWQIILSWNMQTSILTHSFAYLDSFSCLTNASPHFWRLSRGVAGLMCVRVCELITRIHGGFQRFGSALVEQLSLFQSFQFLSEFLSWQANKMVEIIRMLFSHILYIPQGKMWNVLTFIYSWQTGGGHKCCVAHMQKRPGKQDEREAPTSSLSGWKERLREWHPVRLSFQGRHLLWEWCAPSSVWNRVFASAPWAEMPDQPLSIMQMSLSPVVKPWRFLRGLQGGILHSLAQNQCLSSSTPLIL